LPNVIATRDPATGLSSRLHCGQQKSDKHSNDRDDHQQLDEGEAHRASCGMHL
jgi:hypothetical protein